MPPEQLQRLALATAIGLLIGVQRGWQERDAQDGSRVAGIRTFTLIAMLGGICGLSSRGALPLLGLCLIGFALPYGWFEARQARLRGSVSATGFITGLLTFAIGAYAVLGDVTVAVAAGVAATVVLAERQAMHAFLRGITWIELRAGLILLVMTAVLLPVLPDRAVDPWGALNPYQIWLMTVLSGSVFYGGYIAMRLAGERKGLLFAGIMGGIATSTTVTWTFARMVRQDPAVRAPVMTAILAAWIVSLVRMTVLAGAIAPAVAMTLAPSMGAAALVLLAGAGLSYRAARQAQAATLEMHDPLELSLILRFTAILVIIMLLAKWLSSNTGSLGLFALGGVSGILDVDPITLSMADAARGGLNIRTAAGAILAAAATNAIAKAVLAASFGGQRLGLVMGGLTLAALASGMLTYLLL
jgi:uncharacterized membrane protein (DUF4010 family)